MLRDAGIPTRQFSAPDLAAKITSYAIANNDPFLLAYYVDTGTGLLGPPLRLIRFDRAKRDLRRADFADIHALFQRDVPMSCLGSALDIREYRGNIYIDTHANPSAGCVIVLSSTLSFKTAISGWLLGLIAADYAIVRHSEIHFMSVHPMHIGVLDLEQNHLVEVFPFENDPQRREFSGLLKPHIVEKWCKEHNAQCDPENFDTDLKGKLAVNEAARIFGFEAEFNASGFGEATEKQVPRRNVVYVFRQRSGEWEHREFPVAQFRSLFSGKNLQELISSEPNRAFAVTFPAP
ncbi:MAG: hypothetical protein HYX25_01545 [Candidatus Solibacter usitatus]|nr:hypothetical protein [Candidatus Solibacter usitatus]